MSDRGQSEVIGTLLLVALVVIGVSAWGIFVIGGQVVDDEASIDIVPDLTEDGKLPADTLRLSHNGGDDIPISDLELLVTDVTNDMTCSRIDLSTDGSFTDVDGDGDFESGDVWTSATGVCPAYDAGDDVRLQLIHETDQAVIYDERYEVAQ